MTTVSNKMIYLDTYVQERNLRKQNSLYQCTMTGNRLQGNCDVLIYDRYQRTAEIFCLCFSKVGVAQYRYFDESEKMLWLQKEDAVAITYEQAMLLLGDAVRLNYKYQETLEWLEHHPSTHIQRIWQKEYYDVLHCDLGWLLQLQEPIQFVETYLQAIYNKDAALLYDMTATERKQKHSRDVYIYSWNHILEEFEDIIILDKKVDFIDQREQTHCNIYLILSGTQLGGATLLFDMCLQLVYENGYLRLLLDEVLEGNCVSDI